MKISEFGFQRATGEPFCTGLFAQALSLSRSLSETLIRRLGFDQSKFLLEVTCERQIDGQADRPDMWLKIGDNRSEEALPHLVLIESKTFSQETGRQLAQYGQYVDRINDGPNSSFQSARLVLLASFKDMPVSREPDARLSWNDIAEMITNCPKRSEFEQGYLAQVHQHLLSTCCIPVPSGDASEFEQMMWRLAERRSWLTYRDTGKLVSLYVDENDPWIMSRKSDTPRLKQLVLIDKVPPKLNGLTENWLREWIGDNETLAVLCDAVRRNGRNVYSLESSLEALLAKVDTVREAAAKSAEQVNLSTNQHGLE